MKTRLPVLLLLITAFACTNNVDSTAKVLKENATPEISSEPTPNRALEPLSGFFTFFQNNDSSFSPDYFQEFSGAVLLDTLAAATVDENHLEQYKPWFIFNTDSSLAIDPYSHNHVVVKSGGHTKLTSGSPDTEVALIDVKNGNRRRLFYFGPSYMLMDAKWRNNNTLLFALSEVIQPGKISPQIWEVDLNTFTKKVSYYPDTLTVSHTPYSDKKIKNSRL